MPLSPIDRRLAARCHQSQIALVHRTDAICAEVARVYDRLVNRLVAAAADETPGLLSRVHSACAQAKMDAYHVLESQFPELIRQQHREARDNVLRTVPPKWFRMLVPPKHALREDDELAAARVPGISPEEYKRVVERSVFPPLSQADVDRILTSPGYNKLTWQERFRIYVPADQDAIHRELQAGISEGESVSSLRKRMETIVAGSSYKAQRIARTEGRRVAEQGSMEAYSGMGDMLEGMQILAVMDHATRPEHAARNGKIFKRRDSGEFYDDAGQPLPELPDEPNCRCTSIPVLKTPEEFNNDPRIKAEFEDAQRNNIPDPAAYTEWWAGTAEKNRIEAVGVRRYQIIDDRLPDGVKPDWSDFIDTDGSLVPIKQLKIETHQEWQERQIAVRKMLQDRAELYRHVAGKWFVARAEPMLLEPHPTQPPPEPQLKDDDRPAARLLAGPRH